MDTELGNERIGAHWRLTRLRDVPEHLEAAEEVERIRVAEVNRPISARLEGVLVVGKPSTRYRSTHNWFTVNERLEVAIPVRSFADRPLDVAAVEISHSASRRSLPLKSNQPIPSRGKLSLGGRVSFRSSDPLHRALAEERL